MPGPKHWGTNQTVTVLDVELQNIFIPHHVLPLHHQPVVPLCLGRVANMLSSAAIFSAAVLEQ